MSNRTRRQLVLLSLILLLPSLSLAITGDSDRKTFAISRTDTPPVIDGHLDDAVWANAAVVDDFHQTSPASTARRSRRL